jgi:cobyrinic acid a,c-diamide synthase
VLGIVRRDERLRIGSRHLGLLAPDGQEWEHLRSAAAEIVERDVNIDALLDAATNAAPLAFEAPAPPPHAQRTRIALARDEAFWFYDEAGLEALRDAGAELIPYSPLRDPFPGDAQGAFIGGGYPELHAAALEANVAAREGLREAIAAGMPVYAECGGLMYLSRELETAGGTHAMVGALPGRSVMSEKRSALRYVEARVCGDGPLFRQGEIVRGHEFHYSQTKLEADSPAYEIEGEQEGYGLGRVHASYVHVHLGAYPEAVGRFARETAHPTIRATSNKASGKASG